MSNPGIVQLQRWMKDVITSRGNLQNKLHRAEYLHQINEQDVIADTRDVSVSTRLNVYASGYLMRLMECINADFPVLRKFVGEEVFMQFSQASLIFSPSKSYTLYDLGSNFILFLKSTRPERAEISEQDVYLDLPVEIACIERARQEALRFRGFEDKPIGGESVFPVNILFLPDEVRISIPDCLRLVEMKFPLKLLIDKINSDEDYELPAPGKTYLAVSRVNYRLTMEEIEEWQYLFLNACKNTNNLRLAINEASHKSNIPSSVLMADLCVFLPVFLDKGFLLVEEL